MNETSDREPARPDRSAEASVPAQADDLPIVVYPVGWRPPPTAAQALLARLGRFARRRRFVAGVRAALWFVVILGGGLVVTAWLDLLAALPSGLRVGGVLATAGLAVGFTAWSAVAERRRARPMTVARDVDRLRATGGQVAVGLDLTALVEPRAASREPRAVSRQPPTSGRCGTDKTTAGWPSGGHPLTKGLAHVAVSRARDLAADVSAERVAPLRATARAFKSLLVFIVALSLLSLLFPRAFRTAFMRLFNPQGDVPAFSRHIFEVKPGDTRVMYGDAVAVSARIRGAPAERLDLVVVQEDGREEALPMFQDRERVWQAQLTDVTAPLRYWVRAPDGRSKRYRIGVIYTPRIDSLVVRITPPAYTNLPPSEGPLPQGGIAGLVGTEVRLTATSNRPLRAAELDLRPDTGDDATRLTGPPDAAAPRTASVSFSIRQPGRLAFSVVDQDGTRSATPISAPIIVLKDGRPMVRIVEPRARSYATPDADLPVVIEAEDDYGLTSLSLYRSLNGSRFTAAPFDVPIPPAPRLKATGQVPLADLGVQPGDTITLFARAEDSFPGGPRGTESGLVHVTIIARSLYDELVRARATIADFEARYRAAARRLEDLAAKADAAEKALRDETGEDVSDATREALRDLAKALKGAADEARRDAERPPLFALDEDLAASLKALAEALARAASRAEAAADAPTRQESSEALDEALEVLRRRQEDYQQNLKKQLDRFARAFDLLEMQERFVELYRAQDELATRMAGLKDLDDDAEPADRARMRDLKDEQDALARRLDRILDEIRRRATRLPEDEDLKDLRESALTFADDVAKSRARPSMENASLALDIYQGRAGERAAGEAASALKAFIKECESGAEGTAEVCKLAFGPTLQRSAAATLAQLLRAAGLGGGTGIGSGQGGYSVRTPGGENAGLYGPLTTPAGMGESDRRDAEGSFALDSSGGTVGGQLAPEARPGLVYQGVPLHGVPPQHRDHVRAYFRRVAEETSRGALVDESADRQP